jgi:hypothetical protein
MERGRVRVEKQAVEGNDSQRAQIRVLWKYMQCRGEDGDTYSYSGNTLVLIAAKLPPILRPSRFF